MQPAPILEITKKETTPTRREGIVDYILVLHSPHSNHANRMQCTGRHREVMSSGWPVSSSWVGRTVTPEEVYSGPLPQR